MKHFMTFFSLVLLSSFVNAAVLTVNNQNPSPGQFSTIPDAIAAASNGDTIYVHGSANHYTQAFNLAKSLTFIGAGLLPASASSSISVVSGTITLNTGSSGTKFIGLYLGAITNFGSATIHDNIKFDRCAFNSTLTVKGNGWSFNRCVFGNLNGFTANAGFIIFSGSPQNTLIANSIIINSTSSGFANSPHINTTFSQNLIIRVATGFINFQTSGSMQEATFFENIVLGLNVTTNCSNCNYNNNLTFIPSYMTAATLPDLNEINGSSGNTTGDPLFTAFPNNTTVAQYNIANLAVFNPTLSANSPALTAGASNGQIGPFGGLTPFSLFGEPDLPIIRNFIIQNLVAPAGTNLQVEFSATPNN